MERDAVGLESPAERMAPDAWSQGWPQDARGFGLLVEVYLDRLVQYAARRLGNVHDAEDVVQEVWARAFAGRSRGNAVNRVGAYLYRMTANGCADVMRRRLREAPGARRATDSAPAAPETPADLARAEEEAQRAERLLRHLPNAQAEAVRLRVFGELSLAEIAGLTGCSINTVNSRLRSGFKKLRRIVAKERAR